MFANMSDSVAAVRLQDVLAGLLNESDAQPVTLTSSTVGNTEDDEWLVDLLTPPPAKKTKSEHISDDKEATEWLEGLLVWPGTFRKAQLLRDDVTTRVTRSHGHTASAASSSHVVSAPSVCVAVCQHVETEPVVPLASPDASAACEQSITESIASVAGTGDGSVGCDDALPMANDIYISRYWVSLVSSSILGLTRTHEVMPRLMCHPSIMLNFGKPTSVAGKIVQHAVSLVTSYTSRGPVIFKLGLTMDPPHRWGVPGYGYAHDLDFYEKMVVFAVTVDGSTSAMLEALLIHQFKSTDGCRNKAPGGEGLSRALGPFFNYLVYRRIR